MAFYFNQSNVWIDPVSFRFLWGTDEKSWVTENLGLKANQFSARFDKIIQENWKLRFWISIFSKYPKMFIFEAKT